MTKPRLCRFCAAPLTQTLVDLGVSPISNAFIREDQLMQSEEFYPLHAFVCSSCFLVQIDSVEVSSRHFNDSYAYFSSYSASWVKHAETYVEKMMRDYHIGGKHFVVELASNDGYLLQHFVKRGVKVLGIEPSANVANAAVEKGVPTKVEFFGVNCAQKLKAEGMGADLLLGNNVMAHVPDIHDFVAGMKILLKPDGILTLEFPHLFRLLNENQFDTIYHEHFSYFSLQVIKRVFERHGLKIFDVEELTTHGGSLRIYSCHKAATRSIGPAVAKLLEKETNARLEDPATYIEFHKNVLIVKMALLEFLIEAKRAGKTVVGYGAPAKGNTLLNFCGIRTDMIDFTVDASEFKQGRYLPGTRIPIKHPKAILDSKPDYVLILPWNLKEEIMSQMAAIRSWNGKFVIPIPSLKVIE